MALFSIVHVQHNETQDDMVRLLHAESKNRFLAGQKLMRYVRSLMGGNKYAKVEVQINAVKATGTITLASFVADDTVTVNGIVFTGKASPVGAVQFACGVSDTADAAALAVVLNAHTTLDGMIIATSALGVVTLTALYPGELGNAVTLAISAHGSVSAARMASGDNGAATKTHYYGSQDPTA